MSDYSHNIIKEYIYRTVFINDNQGYLGRCIISANRADAEDLSEATMEELQEYITIITQLKIVLEELFDANWMNYSFLGNNFRHLHCHLIPRYSSDREFGGIKFIDDNWGGYRRPNKNFITPREIVEEIKNLIKEKLT